MHACEIMGHLHHHTGVNIFKAVCAHTRGDEGVELSLSAEHPNYSWNLKRNIK